MPSQRGRPFLHVQKAYPMNEVPATGRWGAGVGGGNRAAVYGGAAGWPPVGIAWGSSAKPGLRRR